MSLDILARSARRYQRHEATLQALLARLTDHAERDAVQLAIVLLQSERHATLALMREAA